MNWLAVSYWGHRNMDGPVRRVVEYNFEYYRKKGVGWLLFVGRSLFGKRLHPWKRFNDFKNIKGGTRHGFLCLIFLTKGELSCSICNENFWKFCQTHFGRGGVASLRNAGLRSTKTGGQSFLLDWGGGWAFISVDVKSVAMVQCQLFPTKF